MNTYYIEWSLKCIYAQKKWIYSQFMLYLHSQGVLERFGADWSRLESLYWFPNFTTALTRFFAIENNDSLFVMILSDPP